MRGAFALDAAGGSFYNRFMSQGLRQRLATAIEGLPVVDVHTHLRWQQPAATNLMDLLGYHYITTELGSAGWKYARFRAAKTAEAKMATMLPYFPLIRNTSTFWGLMQICHGLFDFNAETITAGNWQSLYRQANAKMRQKNWGRSVLRDRIRADLSFLTNDYGEDYRGYDKKFFVPSLRIDPLINGIADPDNLRRIEKTTGVALTGLGSLRQAIAKIFATHHARGAKQVSFSLPPDFTFSFVTERAAERVLTAVLRGERVTDAEAVTLRSYVFQQYLERAREHRLPLFLLIGVYRNVFRNERGTSFPKDLLGFEPRMVRAFDEVFNAYPDVKFEFMLLNRVLTHELTAYAKVFPNVYFSGHWWYTFYPSYIQQAMAERLEMLPVNKTNGFFSDAYYVEWGYAKVCVIKKQLTEVLAQKVEQGYFGEDHALFVARRLLHDNAIEHYGL